MKHTLTPRHPILRLLCQHFGAAVVLVLTLVAKLDAQGMQGRVVNAATQQPLAGAIVELLSQGEVQQRAVTNTAGRFLFATPAAASYQIEIRAIGYSPIRGLAATFTGTPLVFPDQQLRPVAIPVKELNARGGTACKKSDANAALPTVLETADNSLRVVQSLVRSGNYAFELRDTVIVTGRAMPPVATATPSQLFDWPVRSIDPEFLKRYGFWIIDSTGPMVRRYFGPDATVLFSPWFLDDHCFYLDGGRAAKDSTLLIRFEPISTTRAEIAGEIHLDRATLAVRRVTWQHRNLPSWIETKATGGEILFSRLEEGLWYPSSWTIRAPSETRRANSGRLDGDGSTRLVGPTTGLLVRTFTVHRVYRP